MTKFHYLTLAYTLFWLVMGFYMMSLGRRLRRVSESLRELRRRLGGAGGRAGADAD
jgi:hypothetical protein